MAFRLVEQEMQMLKTIVKHENEAGYGYGLVEPGSVLHQGVLLGACNYLMHYDFEALGETHVAFLSRSDFKDGTESINS